MDQLRTGDCENCDAQLADIVKYTACCADTYD